MFADKRIGVVIPAYNEAKLICSTVVGIPSFADLIVVVDDCSTDRTHQILEEILPAYPALRIIRHDRNQGVGAAIVTGYRHCLREGVEVLVVVGGDGQMAPQEMPRLLDAVILGGADYAKGNRFSHPQIKTIMPPVRFLGGKVLSTLTGLAAGLPGLQDSQCGYTAISRTALMGVPLERLYPRYGYPNHLLAMLAQHGMRVVDVPVSPIYGVAQSKLRIHRVILPISLILLRAACTRLGDVVARRRGRGRRSPGITTPIGLGGGKEERN